MQPLGKYIVIIGIAIVVIGLIVWLAGDKLGWFGNLPGDIRVEREDFKFYMPITSMILVSILLSLLLWVYRRFF
ncbi:DUF2905 domain-containing protein [Pontibacter amylolyticus]|uniref:DUF2905 domain-containing protein n=1 Tax=Pontibacter amylolyticus TaxID=1424080 RepID=A0ABQ1VYD6_9BACT|nr:DUF2905 domain-containing protein [Pontibacter amylolyticus]GGG05425.1 hypothetical protein GCM10011323_07710 [Pontibacter amylolyticus]